MYGAVVFLSAALLLVLEIAAGRLLAPYIGVSLYTWTSIIGVILAGLSLGHWLGGRLADRGAGHVTVGIALLGCSLTTLCVLPLLLLMADVIQASDLGLLGASFIYVLALFFLPAAAIGILSPLLTTLALRVDQRTGSVVGRMHALSAVGSIAGTFITGYWLVQWLGTRAIVISVAILFFLMALPFLVRVGRGLAALAIAAPLSGMLVLLTHSLNGFASPCDVESSYYCLRVVDETNTSGAVHARSMIIDHMMHSTNSRDDPGLIWTPYAHAMDTLVETHFAQPGSLSYLFGGGGAYTLPRAIRHKYPAAPITVSEIDPAVTALARRRLFFEAGDIEIRHGDVRIALEKGEEASHDVIVTDVFHDVGIPWHLTTREFTALVARALKPGGLYLLNVIDVFPDNRLLQSIVATLDEGFGHVAVWVERPPDEEARLTFVVACSDRNMPTGTLTSRNGPARTWYEIGDFVRSQAATHAAPVLTDDYAPVERLLARMLVTRAGN